MVKLLSKAVVTSVGLVLILSGCISPYKRATGPIELNPGVEQGLRQWASKINPRTFAVTPDGNGYGASYCPEVVCSGHEEAIALYSCEEKSKEGCMIYAHEGKYVWNGEKVE
jgi:hypothetical protein